MHKFKYIQYMVYALSIIEDCFSKRASKCKSNGPSAHLPHLTLDALECRQKHMEMQINTNVGRQQNRWKYEEERTRFIGIVLSVDCWLVLRGDESELIMGI